jgi:hypothetical protein
LVTFLDKPRKPMANRAPLGGYHGHGVAFPQSCAAPDGHH